MIAAGTVVTCATAMSWGTADAASPELRPWLLAGALVAWATAMWLVATRTREARGLALANTHIASLRSLVAAQESRLKEVSDSQGRFVGNLAHEIKTPLTLVLAQLDLMLLDGCDSTAMQAHAKSITGDVRHLSGLVDSFLRLARPFAQRDTSTHVPIDVHDFVLESVVRSQAIARKHGVTLVLNLAEPHDEIPPPEVLGDSVLLEAMLENLVRNAVRFSPAGAKVEILVDVLGATVRIRVRDRGIGVAVENLESVFDWFFHTPGLTLPSAGTGFGLAIAKRVAEHHGGLLELRSENGQGCEFEITLPRHVPAEAAAAGGEPAGALPEVEGDTSSAATTRGTTTVSRGPE